MNDCELCQPGDDVLVMQADWRIVLVRDDHYPGFCRVVWNHHVREMSDLGADQRVQLMEVVFQLEQIVLAVMQPDKINLASLGNVVPHLHWHVIPRYHDDVHFPNPIWGRVERSVNSRLEQRKALLPALMERIRQEWSVQ